MAHRLVVRFVTAIEEQAADETGQGLMEYALILAFVAALSLGVLTVLGTSVNTLIQSVANVFP